MTVVPLTRLVAVWPPPNSRPFQFGRTQEGGARTGQTTTDMQFGALYAHISVKPQALRAQQVAQRMKYSRLLRSQLTATLGLRLSLPCTPACRHAVG